MVHVEGEFDDKDDTSCEDEKEPLLLVWSCNDELLAPEIEVDVELSVMSTEEELDEDGNGDALCEVEKEPPLLVWDCGNELLTLRAEVDVELSVLSVEDKFVDSDELLPPGKEVDVGEFESLIVVRLIELEISKVELVVDAEVMVEL